MACSAPYIVFSEDGGIHNSVRFHGDPANGFIYVNCDDYQGTTPLTWTTYPGIPDYTSSTLASFYAITLGGIFYTVSDTYLKTPFGVNYGKTTQFPLKAIASGVKALGGDQQMFPYPPPVIQIPTPLTASVDKVGGIGGGFNKNNFPKFGDYINEALPRFLQLRWENNREGKWSNPNLISLGKLGELTVTREIRNLGTYRTRMYEIVCDGPFVYTVCEIEEVNEILGD